MPYIDPYRRNKIDGGETPKTAGELNYAFTTLIGYFLAERGTNYQTFNDIIGALEGAKLELYRRRIADYEDEKCRLNGDCY